MNNYFYFLEKGPYPHSYSAVSYNDMIRCVGIGVVGGVDVGSVDVGVDVGRVDVGDVGDVDDGVDGVDGVDGRVDYYFYNFFLNKLHLRLLLHLLLLLPVMWKYPFLLFNCDIKEYTKKFTDCSKKN